VEVAHLGRIDVESASVVPSQKCVKLHAKIHQDIVIEQQCSFSTFNLQRAIIIQHPQSNSSNTVGASGDSMKRSEV
jgi:hypothetical protein